ncbi:DUF1707 domain-containing protein [Streptacidiphilus sp. P02-A3a]|uniref:DUF1707 SHOCT-like domain-containing protein n=1 Tax=Streptacidiphilus sp. P02-A3a TaxID=2704468 RepID=UPI0015FBC2F6|nr:DUF1707 domain-containing protein [Streptacidiphilus sp. P02-A3a]QMU67681.1 DUF1707 domain-containing protein [Streptacidiphilus sp. P02-A3a]
MENSPLPEPLPDPLKKAPGGAEPRPYADPALELRASDADRERVVEALREAYAEGRLTAEEHSERVDSVYAAKTMGELVPLTKDLPAHSEVHRSAPAAAPAPRRTQPEPPARQENPRMIAVFGGTERKGRFRVGSLIKAIVVFGGVSIDLSEAVFDEPELVIDCRAVFGGVEIKVPPHVTLRGGGVNVFGGSDIQEQEGEGPAAPVVTVKTVCVFGGVSAQRKKPGKVKDALRKHLE